MRQDNPKPTARLVFNEGDYNHALRGEIAAQEWVITMGQAWRPDIEGAINRPHHPECPAGERIVPPELVEVGGWNLTVDLWCADAAALDWLRALPLPEHSHLVITEE